MAHQNGEAPRTCDANSWQTRVFDLRSGGRQVGLRSLASMLHQSAPRVAALAATVLLSAATLAGASASPPGDIPDTQAFVAYKGAGYSLKVPDGWARRGSGSSVSFADKYNTIRVELSSAGGAPSVASIKGKELARLKATVKGFASPRVSRVTRRAGPALLVTYRATSAPNAVTGKTITNDVQRYEYWRRGKLLALTLAAPAGSDNVDAYRLITNSLRWG